MDGGPEIALAALPRRCANLECRAPLPAHEGRGRPRKTCDAACAAEVSRVNRATRRAGARVRQLPAMHPFSTRFAQAKQAAGLSFAAIADRMAAEDGHEISVSCLSYWARGRPPKRAADPRIPALERVVGLPRGELSLLVGPRTRTAVPFPAAARPASTEEEAMQELRAYTSRLSGTDRYDTTALRERLHVGADRKPFLRVVAQTVVAVEDYADCAWIYYSPDGDGIATTVKPRKPLRPGRFVTRPQHKLEALELLFGRELLRGESLTFGYVVEEQHVAPPVPIYRRHTRAHGGAGRPSFDLLDMSVSFAVPPRRVWWCRWDRRGERPIGAEEVPVVDGVAGRRLENPVPGMYGLRWEW